MNCVCAVFRSRYIYLKGQGVQKSYDALEVLVVKTEVNLIWVPGHTGVHRNKKADKFAK